jgi:hypothetical protein
MAAETLASEAAAGRLDPDCVNAVLEAAGQRVPRIERPALLARGLQTKQIAHALDIPVKTANRHVQNAYGKIGVSTRAAATLFAMEHGLLHGENSRLSVGPHARSVPRETKASTARATTSARGRKEDT